MRILAVEDEHKIANSIKKVANLAKRQKITINDQTKDFSVEGDQQSLVETFVIFLDNAIKYSPASTSITLSSHKTDHSVAIHIKDQGIGISPEDLPHLFDRFYRADKSRTKTQALGYGLGLSIAKQIIDKHHGQVKISSIIGEGTTFTIFLPTNH